MCRGHCSGPQCDFSKSLKQWHSTVWLNDGSVAASASSDIVPFQSQVVASAPKALEKLDQKRETLRGLKSVLAQKLEKKQKLKEAKLLRAKELEQKRSASAMMLERRPDSRIAETQRSASAMSQVLKPSANYNSNVMPNFNGKIRPLTYLMSSISL